MKKKLLMILLSVAMMVTMMPSVAWAGVTLPDSSGNEVTFNVTNDAELAEVVDILCNTENEQYNTYKGKTVTVQLGEGTFTGTYNIKQFPIWNYNNGSPDNPGAIGTHSEGNTGISNIYRNESNFDTTRIEFKGAADNKTIFRGVFKVFGSGNCNDGPDNGRKTESEQYTYFTGINFSHETLGGIMPIQTYAQAAFVKIDKCRFEKIDRVKIGNSGTSGGYGVYVSITNSEFSNCNTALDGYAKDPTILDNLKVTNCGALLNIQNGETGFGDVTVKNCNITGLGNYVIRTNGGTKADISNSKIHFAATNTDAANEKTLMVAVRGKGDVITFSDCELDENLFFAFKDDYSSNTTGVVTVENCDGYLDYKKISYKKNKTDAAIQENKVVIRKVVAQVTDSAGQPVGDNYGKYETLADALKKVPKNGTETTIKMLADTKENVTIASGSNIVLDLNGKMIKGVENLSKPAPVIKVSKGSTLKIEDNNNTDKTRYFTDDDKDGCYSDLNLEEPASDTDFIKTEHGVITGGVSANGGGIYNQGTLTIGDNVSVVGNNATNATTRAYGGGVYTTGTLSIEGALIAGNSVICTGLDGRAYGGGVYTTGTLSIEGALIAGNSVIGTGLDGRAYGGGVCSSSSASVESIKNATISKNTAKATAGALMAYGGGILLTKASPTTLEGVTIEDNKVVTSGTPNATKTSLLAYGGGIYSNAILTFKNVKVKNNTAEVTTDKNEDQVRQAFGAGVFNAGTLTMDDAGSEISGNIASSTYKSQGGGVYNDSKFTITAGTISGNKVVVTTTGFKNEEEGGGVCQIHAADILLVGGTAQITGNTDSADKANNVWLRDNTVITVSAEASPTSMQIGVITNTKPVTGTPTDITTGTNIADFSSYFSSDDSTYVVGLKGDEEKTVQLQVKPTPTPVNPTPAPQQEIVVPVSGDKNEVEVKAEIEENNAKVETVTKEEIAKVGTGETVTIDVSKVEVGGKKQEISEVTLTKETMENVKASDASGLEIKLSTAEVIIDKDTLEAVTEQAEGNEIHLVVEKDEKAEQELTEPQKETIEQMNEPVVLNAYFVSNGKRISDFQGGKVKILVEYATDKPIRVWFVANEGDKEKVKSNFNASKQIASFEAEHFSHYVIETIDEEPYLVAKAEAKGKTALAVAWTECEGASEYVIYANKCNAKGKKYKVKKIATTDELGYTIKKLGGKKLAKNTFYKVKVVALDESGAKLATAKVVHAATGGYKGKAGNAVKIAATTEALSVEIGKTTEFGVKSVEVYKGKKLPTGHGAQYRFMSSNPKLATVDKNGVVTGVKAGTCTIYVQAPNGLWAEAEVTVGGVDEFYGPAE